MTEEMRDWRELCSAIAKERDSDKVLAMAEELVAVFDERKRLKIVNRDEKSIRGVLSNKESSRPGRPVQRHRHKVRHATESAHFPQRDTTK